MSERSGHISELLQQWIQGDQEALRAVSPIIYDELRRLAHHAHHHLRLERAGPKIVQMKFFGGLSAPEISQLLRISFATVERDWATARIWLRREMHRAASP
jgi:hypothetical protein